MTAAADPAAQYQVEIGELIAEIEARLSTSRHVPGREFSLQAAAFRERAQRARHLAERLARAGSDQWSQVDGEAWRLRQALELSREFFGGDH